DDTDVVFEPDAGMLAAARIVRAEVELARRFGGDATTVLEDCPVRRIDLEADRPALETDAGPIVADRLVVTAGPWTARLIPRFPRPPPPPPPAGALLPPARRRRGGVRAGAAPRVHLQGG